MKRAKANGSAAGESSGRIVSALALGKLLGMNRNTAAGLPAQGCPTVEPADAASGRSWRFDVAEVVAWLERRAAERAAAPLRERIAALEAALGDDARAPVAEGVSRARKRQLEAELLALQLARARGEVIPVTDVDMVLIALMTLTKTKILNAPHRLAPELAAEGTVAGCFKLLDDALRDALHEIADAGEAAQEAHARGEQSDFLANRGLYLPPRHGEDAEAEHGEQDDG
jgi:phage terminase Nu1 subunit (DNA packaging protein)